MPIYTYACERHGSFQLQLSIAACVEPQFCIACGEQMARDFATDWATVQVNTAACQDHNFIPEQHRVLPHHGHVSKQAADRLEAAYAQNLKDQRAAVKKTGRLRKVKSVPAEAYFGKIKQTGDKHYWESPENQAKHKEFDL